MKKKMPPGNVYTISGPRGPVGLKFQSPTSGAEMEIRKNSRGGVAVEIRVYDDEDNGESRMIRLTKAQLDAFVDFFSRKLKKVVDNSEPRPILTRDKEQIQKEVGNETSRMGK